MHMLTTWCRILVTLKGLCCSLLYNCADVSVREFGAPSTSWPTVMPLNSTLECTIARIV